MPTTSLTTAEAGAQITRSNYDWNASLGTALSITWAFRTSGVGGDGVDGPGAGFAQFNAQQMVATMNALQAWSDVANITTTRVGTGTSGAGAYSNNATMLFGDFTSGAKGFAAYAYNPATKDAGVGTANDNEGDVWINSKLPYNASDTYVVGGITYPGLQLGGYGAQVLTHEIGHALGLQHPGDYNASAGYVATYDVDALYVEDTAQYSVMSYFSETNTGADFKGYYGMAPMMDDIAAMQRLYGANTTAFTGDTTYGFNGNSGRAWYTATGVGSISIYCIWDAGGVDTFDYSGYNFAQKIDLNSGRGHFSNVGGMTGNVSIYDGVVIENAKGGSGFDQIIGNAVANYLSGNEGDDALNGNDGNDTLDGGAGADAMQGGAGDDTYVFDGTDSCVDSSGNDTAKVDTATFGSSSLSLFNGNLVGIENLLAVGTGDIDLTGNAGANTLDGSDGRNSIQGGNGSDFLNGHLGDDTLDGGGGNDTIFGGALDNDSLLGGSGNDSLDGGTGNDTLDAGTGTDTLIGGGGDDRLVFRGGSGVANGGQGFDVASVDLTGLAVTANGSSITWSGGSLSFSGIESYDILAASIEGNLIAANGDASIFVSAFARVTVAGGPGTDTLVVNYGWISETITSAYEANAFRNGGNNVGVSYSGIEKFNVTTGSGADYILTGSGADTVRTGAGDDTIDTGVGAAVVDGGSGSDHWTADLSAATGAGVLDLRSATTQSFLGGSVAGIEEIHLSTGGGADVIATLVGTGLLSNDWIDTGGGADTITVGAGRDAVQGGAGNDILVVDYGWIGETITSAYEASAFRNGGNNVGVSYAGIEQFNVTTGSGADYIQTGLGSDTVSTGDGDDQIDTLTGLAFVNGGAGADWWLADFSTATGAGKLDLSLATTQNFLGGTVRGIERLNLTTGSGADNITTLIGASNLYSDVIDTRAGNDTVTVGGGRDQVQGGDGIDTLIVDYSWLTETMTSAYEASAFRNGGNNIGVSYAGFEKFNVTTGSGADYILTGAGDDTVSTGAGDDQIDTQTGIAVVNGGIGVDWWIANFADSTAKSSLDLSSAATQSFLGGSVRGIERLNLTTGSGADKILTLTGLDNGFSDVIDTGGGKDLIQVGGGRDVVNGGLGVDTLVVDYSWLTETMTSAYEASAFRNGGDNIGVSYAGIEKFKVTTGSGADYIQTGSGVDTVSTGAGDDTIDTQAGAAVVDGGAGADRWIADFSASGADGVLDLSAASSRFLGGQVKGIEMITLITGGGDDTVTTLIGASLYGDTISTGAGDDSITVGGGRDYVDAGTGDDTLVAEFSWMSESISSAWEANAFRNGGNNIGVSYAGIEHIDVTGSAFADTLTGSGGSDTITAGGGADFLTGAGGNDIFAYRGVGESAIDASDLIADIAAGDKIDLHLIDADSKTAGNQAFHIANKFTKTAGELVLAYDSGTDRTSVSGDVNGDGKADFTILLVGDHHDFAGFML